MISFYPGPSALYKRIPEFMEEACATGVLSINHRSPEFVAISKKTVALFREKMGLPDGYMLFFTSSATECWEIIAQSLLLKQSYHLYNGAFGEKWLEYTQKLHVDSLGKAFGVHEALNVDNYPIPTNSELIAITHNETSNGTEVNNTIIASFRNKYPEKLIAIDATSSMGGVYLDFKNADIWFASVQKCFGLPAGMAVMICSPKAIARAVELKENNHYNSLISMVERMKDFQTTYTPNVLSIFLLMKVLEAMPTIEVISEKSYQNAQNWYDFFIGINGFDVLVTDPTIRSTTVITVKGTEEAIKILKMKAKENGILLGNGYGTWKSDTFRIANFPAIETESINKLKEFLTTFRLKF